MQLQEIKLPFSIKKPVLALGSQAKNTLCFARGNLAYLSQQHTDLSCLKDFLNFKKAVKYFCKKRPQIIAYDLHPEYQSTKYAQGFNPLAVRLVSVQHHHAHIASCMAENKLHNQKVIGVAFDGTGMGQGGSLWGAEFLIADYKNFQRKAHLKEIPLLGGQAAVLEPARLAMLWLYFIYKDRFLKLGINFTQDIERRKWRVLKNIYLSGLNSYPASSMGRLFDAIGSLVLGIDKVGAEAELAIKLEQLATSYQLGAAGYRFKITRGEDEYILDPAPIFRQIVLDLKAKEKKEKIAYRFHCAVAQLIRRVCLIINREYKINRVVLSGGVFQNNLLLRLSSRLLYKTGFTVFTHKLLSPNDSSISLGEAVVGYFRG